jgi:hypothetical protein
LRMIESTDKNGVARGKPNGEEAGQAHTGSQTKNMPKVTALAVTAIGILLLPMSHLIATREHLLSELLFFAGIGVRPSIAANAVLAVDALDLKIQMKNAHPSTQERFEGIALEHVARLHRTYSTWAQENQDLMGSLHLKLKVDRSGAVVGIDPLASYLTNANFIHVVVAEVRHWKFPEGITEAAEITVPLLFVPRGMDPNTAVQWERNFRRAEGNGKVLTEIRTVNNSPISVDGEPAAKSPSAVTPPRQESTRPLSARIQSSKPENESLGAFKTNQSVTLREHPRFSSKRVHDLDGDTPLMLLENKGDWLKVKLADAGSIGFVRKEFVTPIN